MVMVAVAGLLKTRVVVIDAGWPSISVVMIAVMVLVLTWPPSSSDEVEAGAGAAVVVVVVNGGAVIVNVAVVVAMAIVVVVWCGVSGCNRDGGGTHLMKTVNVRRQHGSGCRGWWLSTWSW